MIHKSALILICTMAVVAGCSSKADYASTVTITHDEAKKTITFGNHDMSMVLSYDKTAHLSNLVLRGQELVDGNDGMYSMIRSKTATYSTLQLPSDPEVRIHGNTISITRIQYGSPGESISEAWTFSVYDDSIAFDLDRTLSQSIMAIHVASPVFTFRSIDTWEGAYQDYGGLAWFYLFNKERDTYGVHSHSSEFWNSKTGIGMTVSVSAPGNKVAMNYSRSPDQKLLFDVGVSVDEFIPRFDHDTHRRRYVRDTTDVWSDVQIPAGTTRQHVTLQAFGYEQEFGRGKLVGINQEEVSSVLNTIARIGVIDKQHFGGNSWHTPYGPICLHEQYIAQMGLGINDEKYLKGYQECLDYYRDNAIKPDGRVWPRWAYSNEDAMPNQFTDKGFYEAQWGYLLDSNPDLVTNVAELYDQTGDLEWARTHQRSCEKALDWIIARDSNGNGLVEMMTDSYKQRKGSDWIDIIWASYENAFVNAKLYHALVLWSAIEDQLGNGEGGSRYREFAVKLKSSFNQTTRNGGFWDEQKKCYVHWRDKDGSIHGKNMVTPVNFMAIAYGICDDTVRRSAILDAIEGQMEKEKLFFWPICMYSYSLGEGNDWQFPFPNYENGDIFLSWGSVGVKAYASYKPELALKYVKNVLTQYAKDGLAFQRYGREHQDGRGDDILAGNSLAVVGLYQSIYGINPKYNRLYLDPHITGELVGTRVRYHFRGNNLTIGLDADRSFISDDRFRISSSGDFGFFASGDTLSYYEGKTNDASMTVITPPGSLLEVGIQQWSADKIVLQQSGGQATKQLDFRINALSPDQDYTISVEGKEVEHVKSNDQGAIVFRVTPANRTVRIEISGNQ